MARATANAPISTGTRSKEAPSLVARARPITATRDRLTTAATSVPARAHTASVLSAPKRRNQRKPYTVATALPMGSELVSACEPKVSLSSVHQGGRRCPAMSRSRCMAAKAT